MLKQLQPPPQKYYRDQDGIHEGADTISMTKAIDTMRLQK